MVCQPPGRRPTPRNAADAALQFLPVNVDDRRQVETQTDARTCERVAVVVKHGELMPETRRANCVRKTNRMRRLRSRSAVPAALSAR